MFRKPINLVCVLVAAMLLAACSNAGEAGTRVPTTAPRAGQLTPYASPSPTAPPAIPPDPSTPTLLPSPTATPRIHEVIKGEDMMGIALRYGISLDELKAANPTVDPRFMSIGTALIIPESESAPTATLPAGPSAGQTPTPVPVESGTTHCTRMQDGGAWCFQLLHNNQDFPLEGVTAIFRLTGSQAEPVLEQRAFLPLDRLPPGTALPLAAFFAPQDTAGLTGPLAASSELLVSLPSPEDGRYLSSHAANQKVMISEDGLSAAITLDVVLDQPDTEARRIWVAAVAYDAAEQVIGVRRWEMQREEPLKTGQSMPVELNLYSTGGAISRVELIPELRP